ncbi:TlpA family protein disulfide reductase [Simiduia sp. 21SJ11W-1]|uniref:TlpA family protein disulfide reductase n=1 Tax=Simiduia sp. 21SJ11W-1 TaxID=2909669 RepID=UPI0020A0C79B|nr:TlpA disulfide reductase family protein [Simiduia sp. 21SJ11W-1]UTA48485.1 TlpA family protein disulfide reductase [Simiduia sp. 21SJ11W-1]
MMKIYLYLLVAFCALGASANVLADSVPGTKPFNYLGKDYHGNRIELDDYKGKVVVVSFWATWCPPCIKELSVLAQIQKQVGTDHLQVVAVSHKNSRKVFSEVAKSFDQIPVKFTFDKRSYVANAYGLKALPYMLIIGRDGIVKSKYVGYREDQIHLWVDELNALLATAP